MYFAYGREVNFCWPGDGLWQVGISKDGHTPNYPVLQALPTI